jgi:hypothetical protein
MKIKYLSFVLLFFAFVSGVRANWEYAAPGGYYADAGGRMTLAVRGGMAYGMAGMTNELGDFQYPIFDDTDTEIGRVILGDLPAANDFKEMSWAAGVSVGWRLSGSPQWRFEADWTHIAKAEYNASPMFSGELPLMYSEMYEGTLQMDAGNVQSNVKTDIFSAFAYYDFFEGYQKPVREFIPYIGVGLGYYNSKTMLNLSDVYGNLSFDDQMHDFAVDTGAAALRFYTSETTTGNVSVSGALGMSYVIEDGLSIDFGLRLTWLPKVEWELNNELAGEEVLATIGQKSLTIFGAENMLYGTATIGIRFEF